MNIYPAHQILAGVTRYAAYCHAEGILGTCTVQQAKTFLGENHCFLEDWTPTPPKLTGSQKWLAEQTAKDEAKAKAAKEAGDAQH